MADNGTHKPWWQSIPATTAAAVALLTAATALIHEITSANIKSIFGASQAPDVETIIDRTYVATTDVRVWPSPNPTVEPIAEIKQGTVLRVRAKIKGAEFYIVDFGQGVGYLAMRNVIEEREWRQERSQERVQRQITSPQAALPSMVQPVSPAPPAVTASPGAWFPKGARVGPPWNHEVAVRSAPNEGAQILSMLSPGRLLPSSVFRGGIAELLGKVNGEEWYQIGLLGQAVGYVPGSEVTEIWPRQQPLDGPAGRPAWNVTLADGLKVQLFDLGTNFDLYFDVKCSFTTCNTIGVYTGNPRKDEKLDTRYFTSQPILGSWKQDEVVEVYVKLPRIVLEPRNIELWSCIGTETVCKPQKIPLKG